MNRNAINELLQSDSFDENLNALNSKIAELAPMIEAAGGIPEIQKNIAITNKKQSLADQALDDAKSQAELIIEAANTKADEILLVAQERSEQLSALSDAKMKAANDKEAELKALQGSLSQYETKLKGLESVLAKKAKKLEQDQVEIDRKKALLEQL